MTLDEKLFSADRYSWFKRKFTTVEDLRLAGFITEVSESVMKLANFARASKYVPDPDCITCDNKAQIGDLCNMCWQDLEVNDEDGLQENAQ